MDNFDTKDAKYAPKWRCEKCGRLIRGLPECPCREETCEVIPLKSPSVAEEVLSALLEHMKAGRVKALVISGRREYTEEEKQDRGSEGSNGFLMRYWFGGESAIECLGLSQMMTGIIERFVNKDEDLIG